MPVDSHNPQDDTQAVLIAQRQAGGQLIKTKRTSIRPRLSIREAARRAGVSEGWWRQMENGGRHVAGIWVPFNPGDVRDVLRAARVVGLDPRTVFRTAGLEDEYPEGYEPVVITDVIPAEQDRSRSPDGRMDEIEARLERVESILAQLVSDDAEEARRP